MADPTTPNLGLILPVAHEQTWNTPTNSNWTTVDTWAGGVVVEAPAGSQTVTQPNGTYLNQNSPLIVGSPAVLRFGLTANSPNGSISETSQGTYSMDANTPGDGEGTVKVAVANLLTGLQVNGAAPSGYLLVGDGSHFVPSATLPASALSYQTVQTSGATVTQRPKLNFLAPFVVNDDASNTSSDVVLPNSGVTPGAYTSANITVDALGRVTAAANGSAAPSLTVTQTEVHSARAWTTVYHNTSGGLMLISGYALTPAGSSVGNYACYSDAAATPTQVVWANEFTATVTNTPAGFQFSVPPGYYYKVVVTGDIAGSPLIWIETVLTI